jgi:hypothetical protein
LSNIFLRQLQLLAEVEELRQELSKLRGIIAGSKDRQKEAQAEVKRLEKEMADFKDNKDAKLNEIKVTGRCPTSGCRRLFPDTAPNPCRLTSLGGRKKSQSRRLPSRLGKRRCKLLSSRFVSLPVAVAPESC